MAIKDSQWQEAFSKGKAFEQQKDRHLRKSKGVFYTPEEIITYMVPEVLESVDLAENPRIKILDPACGAGFFLMGVLDALKERFEREWDRIGRRHPDVIREIKEKGLACFIVENNLYGADIDPEAVGHVREQLELHVGKACASNVLCCDALIADWTQQFDIIIGNPPYIGHKSVSQDYKKLLQEKYKGIYVDKSDILYCFLQMAIDHVAQGGVVSFITSRYFMEGPSAAGLREYILNHCRIIEIVDFSGYEVFEDAGVASCIITLKKGQGDKCASLLQPPKGTSRSNMNINAFERFTVSEACFDKAGWMLIPDAKYKVFDLIRRQGTHDLMEVFESRQGIITGCDKAFVITPEEAEKEGIEAGLLKPWVKNSYVGKFKVRDHKQLLIYADLIENETTHPNAIRHIGQYRLRLEERRECKKGIRKWYQLQWGRKMESFETAKLIYPYKSSCNRFAIDANGYFCSADVYSLILKEAFKDKVSLEYITLLLNSRLMEFYFKCFAKKLSNTLYDYYPNTVLKIRLNLGCIDNMLESYARQISGVVDDAELTDLLIKADQRIYALYHLTEDQIRLVEEEFE